MYRNFITDDIVKKRIIQLIRSSLEKLNISVETIDVSVPADRRFGDFSSNVAFFLAKKEGKSPLETAQRITNELPVNSIVSRVEVVAPGFINFFLQDEFILSSFQTVKPHKLSYGQGKTVVTDTSHPNIAKPMGIHHILSTIIGASINNILKYCGYKVVRDNFIGDVGTQFGKLIYAYKAWGNKKTIEKNPIPELLKLYVEFHEKAETDAAMEDHGRAEFKKLEDGDIENRRLWQWMKNISLKEFNRTYKRMKVSFDIMHGESFYKDKMAPIVELGKKKGVFVTGEKGALVCQFPGESGLPVCVIQKSDGATMYHTRDLARKAFLEKTYHPDIILMVVDSAQELHFRQLFAMIRMLKLSQAELIHVSFGRMQFKDRQMSTRKGNIIYLEDVLNEAVTRTEELLHAKEVHFPKQEQKRLIEIIALGAVKYGILSQNRNTNIVFDWDKIVTLEGNSGPYLQYTYARGMSILRKAKEKTSNKITNKTSLDPMEKALIMQLLQFPEVVMFSCKEYKPNLIANYLYELSGFFNSFYNKLPVLQAEGAQRTLRLKIVKESCKILKVGLGLLGIDVPKRM